MEETNERAAENMEQGAKAQNESLGAVFVHDEPKRHRNRSKGTGNTTTNIGKIITTMSDAVAWAVDNTSGNPKAKFKAFSKSEQPIVADTICALIKKADEAMSDIPESGDGETVSEGGEFGVELRSAVDVVEWLQAFTDDVAAIPKRRTLSALEVGILAQAVHDFRAEIKELKEKLNSDKAQFDELKAQNAKLQADLEGTEKSLRKAEADLAIANKHGSVDTDHAYLNKYEDVEAWLARVESESKTGNNRPKYLESRESTVLAQAFSYLKGQNSRMEDTIAKRLGDIARLNLENTKLKEQISDMERGQNGEGEKIPNRQESGESKVSKGKIIVHDIEENEETAPMTAEAKAAMARYDELRKRWQKAQKATQGNKKGVGEGRPLFNNPGNHTF